MRSLRIGLVVVALLGLRGAGAGEPGRGVEGLAWLEGTWRGKLGEADFEARYTGAEGGRILSTSKSVADGRLEFFEFEDFEARGERVVLQPYPMGKRAASFELESLDAATRTAVFVNPKNDFPRRIVYARRADDRLWIVCEGEEGGKPVKMELDLRRR